MKLARGVLRPFLVALLFAALVTGALALVREGRREFDALSTAQSDNLQWVLAQVEVEFLALDVALLRGTTAGAEILPELRLRFDIFYSRIDTLRNSPLYAPMRDKPAFGGALDRIWAAITDSVPVFDGPDPALVAALPEIEGRFSDLRPAVRQIGLIGLAHFAEAADTRREGFLGTLRNLAWLTLALFVGLVVLVALLWRGLRVLDDHARDARLSASRRDAVVSSSLDAVIVANSAGRILEANAAVAQVFGFAPEELVGRKMDDTIIPHHLREAHSEGMKRYNHTREPHVVGKGRVQLEGLHKGGQIFPVELSISSAQSVDGEVFVSFLRDITRRVTAETELREARDRAEAGERSKARMLATMSHEMRTPLNGLMGTLELMQDTDLTPAQERYVQVMHSSGEVLLHHINDVLDISRLDAGKMPVEARVFALNPFLEALAASQQPLAEQAGNRLTLRAMDGHDVVRGDHVRLRQVLINLLGNAIKFTEGGTIELEAERLPVEDMVEFRVIDSGLGIPEDQLSRIFEDFVTLDASYGRVHGGTGLGLGIVRRMVEAMGGTFGVESEHGEGSLFWVRVPLAEAARRSPDSPENAAGVAVEAHEVRKDVLMVEDNEINRMILREMLESLGHNVTEAHDGQAGVEVAAKRRFDLILMDISMPRLDGVAAAQQIRSAAGACRDVPIVALTAHAMPDEIARFRSVGMARTIVKPVTRAALANVLATLTDGAPQGPVSSAPPEEAGPPFIDMSVLDDLRQSLGDAGFLRISRKFVTDMDAEIAFLAGPDGQRATLPDLQAKVHTLAGGCGLMGATALRAALSRIETALKQGEGRPDAVSLETLANLWTQTRPGYTSATPNGKPEV